MKTFFFYSEIKTSSRQKYSESISLHNVNHSFIYPHNGYVDICISWVFYSSSSPLFLVCFLHSCFLTPVVQEQLWAGPPQGLWGELLMRQ